MKYKYVIVDTTNLFFKVYESILKGQNLEDKNIKTDQISEIINLMLELCLFLERDYSYSDTGEFYFLFDNSQTQIKLRKILDESYKSNRDKARMPKNLYSVLRLFSNILKTYSDNFHVLFAEKLEADDLTFPLIKRLDIDVTQKALVVSDDMDWSRNIAENVHWFNWRTVYTPEEFYKKYNFFPTEEAVCIYKSFLGDPSDNIPKGVPGVGDDKLKQLVIEIISRYKTLPEFLKKIDSADFLDIKLRNLILSSMKRLKKNYDLVIPLLVDRDISTYIQKCQKNWTQCRIYYESLNIEVPDHMKSSSEILDTFFS